MPSAYQAIRGMVTPLLNAFFRVQVIGRENLPASGPYVLVMGPHRTELESALVACALPEVEIHFFAKADYWEGSALVRAFMDGTGMIPVNRTDGRAAAQQILLGAELLRRGKVVAFYPEATRGGDEYVHKGHTGAVRAAIQGGNVPLVPIGLVGMRKLNPPGAKGLRRFRPGRAAIVIGAPIYPLMHKPGETPDTRAKGLAMSVVEGDSLLSRPVTGVHVRLLTTQIMKEIARLSSAPYLDEYLKIGAAGKGEG